MSVSKLLPAGGANDFNVSLTGPYTTVAFTKEYAAGGYSIVSAINDGTLDIYIFNADGSSAGYASTKSLNASKGFNKMVIIGGTAGDLLSFTYKLTFTSTGSTTETTAGPVVLTNSNTAFPASTSTTNITGANFASNMTARFVSNADTSSVYTASLVNRTSATSATITRSTSLPVTKGPFSLYVSNPGVSDPIGSNSHLVSSSVYVGVPIWTTTSLSVFSKNVAYSYQLAATNGDGTSSSTSNGVLTYSLVSGTLPTGITLSSSGLLSGTPTTSTTQNLVFRVTSQEGLTADKSLTLSDSPPSWVTSGALTAAQNGVAYSYQLVASDDQGSITSWALVSGTLPTGLSLNTSTGVISGTPTSAGSSSFVISATDSNGSTTNSGTLTLYIASVVVTSFTAVGTTSWTYPANAVAGAGVQYLVVGGGGGCGEGNAGGGAGGAGAMIEGTYTLTPGNSYTVVVGAGGLGCWQDNWARGTNGGNSQFHTAIANGGGRGGYSGVSANSGGSGGGGSGPNTPNGGAAAGSAGTVPSGATGYVNAGYQWESGGGSWGRGGGGGGAGGAAFSYTGGSGSVWGGGGAGRASSITGSSVTYATGGSGFGGTNNPVNSADRNPNTGDGGWGNSDGNAGGAGGSGIVVVKYFA